MTTHSITLKLDVVRVRAMHSPSAGVDEDQPGVDSVAVLPFTLTRSWSEIKTSICGCFGLFQCPQIGKVDRLESKSVGFTCLRQIEDYFQILYTATGLSLRRNTGNDQNMLWLTTGSHVELSVTSASVKRGYAVRVWCRFAVEKETSQTFFGPCPVA